MKSNNMNKGFTPIEIGILDELDHDNDLIIICLSYIIKEIPKILKIDENEMSIFLASMHNFLGSNYPVIGIRFSSKIDLNKINLIDFEEEIENWIKYNGGVENLKKESFNIKTINWETLKKVKEFPNFE